MELLVNENCSGSVQVMQWMSHGYLDVVHPDLQQEAWTGEYFTCNLRINNHIFVGRSTNQVAYIERCVLVEVNLKSLAAFSQSSGKPYVPSIAIAFLVFSSFIMETASFRLANGYTPLSLSSPNFILPEDKRPLLSQVPTLASIPIINMNEDDYESLVKKVSQACEEYGFFQIINHGVPEEFCRRMMTAVSDFFHLPPEERAPLFTDDKTKPVRVSNYYIKVQGQEKVTMWSETFAHPWHPVDEFTHLLPQNPPQYREVVAEYAREIGGLTSRLLSLISEGLGLEKDCLQKRIGENPRLAAQANYYPPCPDPELTLGLPVHTDINALTILRQSEGVTGLQVIKDGNWVAVDPVPNAFVINLGDQIQVLSNGRYKSVHHRAVTNKELPRVSLAMFYEPNKDSIIGPIEDLIDEQHPPLYRSYLYAEFLAEFHKQEGTRRRVKELFQLRNAKGTQL